MNFETNTSLKSCLRKQQISKYTTNVVVNVFSKWTENGRDTD